MKTKLIGKWIVTPLLMCGNNYHKLYDDSKINSSSPIYCPKHSHKLKNKRRNK